MKMSFLFLLSFISVFSLAQNTVSGIVNDEYGNGQAQVLVLNINKNKSVFSDAKGNYIISAETGDELRFVKDGFYRAQLSIDEKILSEVHTVTLNHVEILIPEVKLQFLPTGNLEKDSRNAGVPKKITALNRSMEKYMKSPLSEPLPKNEIQKTFKGHDFQRGQIDVIKTVALIVSLINKAEKPKISTPNFYETQTFIKEIKSRINLDFLRSYGMNDESIDAFLLYAEDSHQMSKNYRKDFNEEKIKNVLKYAFQQYSKLHDVSK